VYDDENLNFFAFITWQPSGKCPPPWPRGIRIEWGCSWMGNSCRSTLDGLLLNIDSYSVMQRDESRLTSVVQLPEGTLNTSTIPYILSISAIIGDENDYPLLYVEQMLYISPTGSMAGMAETRVSVPTDSVPFQSLRRSIPKVMPDSLPFRMRWSDYPEFFVNKQRYSASLSPDANHPNMVVDILPSRAPTGGFCASTVGTDVQTPDASTGLVRVRYYCENWTGSDSDSYPLSYHFRTFYRCEYIFEFPDFFSANKILSSMQINSSEEMSMMHDANER
jgi:hypothetical protein